MISSACILLKTALFGLGLFALVGHLPDVESAGDEMRRELAARQAEEARKQLEPMIGDWSEPVNGLRLRVSCQQPVLTIEELLRLNIELENVGEQPLDIADPHVLPIIEAPDDQSFGEDPSAHVTVYAEPVSARIFSCPKLARAEIAFAGCPVFRLMPGAHWRLQIVGHRGPRQDKLQQQMQQVGQPQKREPEEVLFLYAGHPGTYRLWVQYRVHENDVPEWVWRGKIVAPPIFIEIIPH